ncbi:MAG TPA: NAD(P)H-hydrate dehydratase [Candidatus Binatia bacterium]|nr:NAD(P)H-hydrate dehydratase [Candidatus Binatia bacterium]
MSSAAPLGERGRLFVVTSDEMRRMDAGTIARGTPGEALMERAGALAADVVRRRFGRQLRHGVLVVAGKGNNGGDAFVVARHLRRRGVRVEVALAARESDVGGDARTNLDRWKRMRGRIREISEGGLTTLAEAGSRAGVIVDGLFGTGLRGKLDERSQAIVEALNGAPAPILAVDVPSGLDADRGLPLGAAVQATVTVTFAYPKVGLVVHPGAEFAGEVVVADIGISHQALREVAPRQRLLTAAAVGASLPRRAQDSHKGSYGHVLVLAGALGKSGAAMLCGRASLRAGAGLTTIASPSPSLVMIPAQTPELMTEPLPDHEGGWRFANDDAPRLARLFDGKDAVVFGPGIGVTPSTRALSEWLIASSPLPLVIDADGLNCLAGQIGWLKKRRSPVVLTPHPGEMARLLSCSVGDIQGNRVDCARRLAADYGVTVALKGSRTVVADPGGVVTINPTGNPGMASGGMGDALAGMIGSLLAQGLEGTEATEVAAFWHGAAADRVASRRGEAGLLASDVIDALPPTLRGLQEDLFADAPSA